MGKGIAAEFRTRYPSMYKEYQSICKKGLLQPGKLWLWYGPDRWVLNFPTRKHWRNPSKLEWIEAGLLKFADNFEKKNIREIAFPRLGCGNGGLQWGQVQPLMERYLAELPIPVFIHLHDVDTGLPEHIEAAESPRLHTFDEFLLLLGEMVKSFPRNSASDLRASLDDKDRTLTILTQARTTTVSEDDLYDVWRALLTGIVTKEKLSWPAGPAAGDLLEILAALPGIQSVSINRPPSTDVESAIQLQHNDTIEAVR